MLGGFPGGGQYIWVLKCSVISSSPSVLPTTLLPEDGRSKLSSQQHAGPDPLASIPFQELTPVWGTCTPSRVGLPEAVGMQAALQSLRESCYCALESKGQGEDPGVPERPTVTAPTWHLRHRWYVQPHRGVGTKSVFQWSEIMKAATPVSHSDSHHGLLLNDLHLCFPTLPSSVPTHACCSLFLASLHLSLYVFGAAGLLEGSIFVFSWVKCLASCLQE